MLGGTLFTGHNGAAAEPGLITLDPDGPPCNSGNQGSLEQFASISGLGRLSAKAPALLAEAASRGDAEALAIWAEYGRLLGDRHHIAGVRVHTTTRAGGRRAGWSQSPLSSRGAPGGGSAGAGRFQGGLRIEACALGNGAGRLGAARLALQRLR